MAWIRPIGAVLFAIAGAAALLPQTVASAASGDTASITHVSCPAAGDCVAVGSALTPDGASGDGGFIATTADNGVSWTTRTIPPNILQFEDVTCPTSADCFAIGVFEKSGPAVDVVLASTDGGATWTQQPALPSGNAASIGSISCTTSQACIAVGSSFAYVTTNGGRSWATTTLPPNVFLTGVTCAQSGPCLALGTSSQPNQQGSNVVELITTNNGAQWTNKGNPFQAPVNSGDARPSDVSCPSSSVCVAVGLNQAKPGGGYAAAAWTSNDGGASWTAHPLGGGSTISCPTVTDCVTDGNGHTEWSSDGGSTWNEASAPGDSSSTDQVSCGSANDCIAAGNSATQPFAPAVMATTDGAHTWSDVASPSHLPSPVTAPPPPFDVAFQSGAGSLESIGPSGPANWGLGMAPGTSPSVMRVGANGYEIAFQANGGSLWSVGNLGWTNWGVGMAANTSPSMVRLSNGGYEIAFQAYGGSLWTIGTAGWTNWGVGMQPETSPSVVALPNGGFEVAFQGYGGRLWSVGTAGWTNWNVGMAPNTSPSVFAPSNGGYEIAFQAYGGALWSVGSSGWTNWGVGMDPGTSPSAAQLTNGYEIAFNANGGTLWTVGSYRWVDWHLAVAPDTSPSLLPITTGDFVVAFQSYDGDLRTVSAPLGWTDWPMGLAASTSPATS